MAGPDYPAVDTQGKLDVQTGLVVRGAYLQPVKRKHDESV
jgi:hypothetical protein